MNLATRVTTALTNDNVAITSAEEAEIRLAALLHDIGHCVFSHGSEFFYSQFDELIQARSDPELKGCLPSESECVNYCIITSEEFRTLLWDPIRRECQRDEENTAKRYNFLDQVKLKHVAQMVVGLPPGNLPERRFHAEIINGRSML